MTVEDTAGLVSKVFSIAVIISIIFLIFQADSISFVVKATPILIAPMLMIWSPKSALVSFSSKTSIREVRLWGLMGLLLLAIPFWVFLWMAW